MIAKGDRDRSSFKINYQYIEIDPNSLTESEKNLQQKLILQEENGGSLLVGLITLILLATIIGCAMLICNCLLNRNRQNALTKIQML